jgi:hypothetical protein
MVGVISESLIEGHVNTDTYAVTRKALRIAQRRLHAAFDYCDIIAAYKLGSLAGDFSFCT